MHHLRLCVLGLLVAGTAAAQSGLPLIRTGNADVTLLAAATGVNPGGTIDLAIRFKIQDGWHIYWQNRGEGGKEPTFTWRLPQGWTVGPLRFPPPQRHVDEAGANTFILDGEPVVLTTLTAPVSANPGAPVEIGLQVEWLACKDVCVLGNKRVGVSIPVVESLGQVAPANESLFRSARAALPLPADKAKYLKLSAVASVDRIRPGAAFKVAVILDIQAEHHLNSHEPLSEFLIGTDLFNHTSDGLEIERPVFPPGIVEAGAEGMEPQSLYRGRTIVVLPVQADGKLSGEQVRISGVVTYQVCSDRTKQCYAPTAAEWSLALPVAKGDEPMVAANTDVFVAAAKANSASSRPVEVAATDGQPENSSPTSSGDDNSAVGSAAKGVMSRLGAIQLALARYGLFGYLLMAVLGGFLLNLMPCVLPVISIKVLSFVQQAKESRARVLALGIAFSAGILLSFIALGVFVVMLGRQWGGLFQYPQAVIILAAVVTAFALSLFGVFTLNAPRFVGGLGGKVPREGLGNAFCMGLLATALGTACTAPFLGFVIAIASQQTALMGMSIFLAAGVGMAFPYVLLASHPAWLRVIPRPGPWLNIFEEVMGFVLMATVIWLLNTVFAQIGGEGLVWTLVFLLFVSLAAWAYGKVQFDATRSRKLAHYGASILLIGMGWGVCFLMGTSIPELEERQRQQWLARGAAVHGEDGIPWIPYTRDRARQTVEAGHTVFVDYTAEWCANCKANEKLVINTEAVRQTMSRLGVVPFQANYTWRDPDITADLERYDRAGVPMYLVIPAGRPDEGFVLDELLTQSSVIKALEKAGPSTATGAPILQATREQPPREAREMGSQPLGAPQ